MTKNQNIYIGLPVVTEFFSALEKENIQYCHWKSNAALDRTFTGENDIDILIAKKDISKFTVIALQLGYKSVTYPISDKNLPGIESFYAYDFDKKIYVHLHVHYHLVFGNDALKNFRMPVEKAMLETAVTDEKFGIKRSLPEFELIYLVLRLTSKFSFFQSLLFKKRRKVGKYARMELDWLRERVSDEKLKFVLEKYFTFLKFSQFEKFRKSIENKNGMRLFEKRRMRKNLDQILSSYSLMGVGKGNFLRKWRVVWNVLNGKFKWKSTKAEITTGGSFISIVGGDGSGKTTLIKSLRKWLGSKFEVQNIHLGKPPRTNLTLLFDIVTKLFFMRKNVRVNIDNPSTREENLKRIDYVWMMRKVLNARDRYKIYKKAQRFVSNGGIVISDRFPVTFLTRMDCPRCEDFPQLKNKKWVNWLIQKERSYFDKMIVPDIPLILKLPPDIAVARKFDEDPIYVRYRNEEVFSFDWASQGFHEIDAQRTPEEIQKEVKQLIWARL